MDATGRIPGLSRTGTRSQERQKPQEEVAMNIPEILFGMTMTLISIGGSIVIIMLIVRAIQNGRDTRERAFNAALEKGIYDPSIMSRTSVNSGAASLGWGIFFAMVGIALLIGFMILGIAGDAALGGLIPLAIGIGLIVFHIIMKRNSKDIERNGEPIRFDPSVGVTESTKADREVLGG